MTVAAATPQMSQSGLNLLRIVLASYFIALSLGLIEGTNTTLILHHAASPKIADFAANTSVFLLAYLVLMGMWLRPAALLLGTFVLAASAYATFVYHPPQLMSDFWRDIALVSGLMMTYLQTSSRGTRRRAMLRRLPRARKVQPGVTVTPRRVAPLSARKDSTQRPVITFPANDAPDVVNIFAA